MQFITCIILARIQPNVRYMMGTDEQRGNSNKMSGRQLEWTTIHIFVLKLD